MSDFFSSFVSQVISVADMETERQRIAAITPFDDARTEAIRVVRRWTRVFIAGKAAERSVIDLQDTILNSAAEIAVVNAVRIAFSDFLTAANAATTLGELNTAWQTYQTDITAI